MYAEERQQWIVENARTNGRVDVAVDVRDVWAAQARGAPPARPAARPARGQR